MKFTKMQGIGNDYIYFNGFEEHIASPKELSVRLSDRHFGVGGDGIVLILPSDKADFRMRMFNADGSEGKMCGNASRCIGKYVYERGLTNKKSVTLETLSGIKTLDLHVQNGVVRSVTVNMGLPELSAEKIPVLLPEERVIGETLKVGNTEYEITCVSMGNPHCVTFCREIDSLELPKIGPMFENHPIFPDRVNTEFVRILGDSAFQMRVWERGSGETLACGTGASAAAVACVLNGYCKKDEEIEAHLLGGILKIKVTDAGVLMTGPAEFCFDGEIKE